MLFEIDQAHASKPADANKFSRPATIRESGRSDFSDHSPSVAGARGRRYEFVRCRHSIVCRPAEFQRP
jgi:hypothetical protein